MAVNMHMQTNQIKSIKVERFISILVSRRVAFVCVCVKYLLIANFHKFDSIPYSVTFDSNKKLNVV